jgi:hypothetical protein
MVRVNTPFRATIADDYRGLVFPPPHCQPANREMVAGWALAVECLRPVAILPMGVMRPSRLLRPPVKKQGNTWPSK